MWHWSQEEAIAKTTARPWAKGIHSGRATNSLLPFYAWNIDNYLYLAEIWELFAYCNVEILHRGELLGQTELTWCQDVGFFPSVAPIPTGIQNLWQRHCLRILLAFLSGLWVVMDQEWSWQLPNISFGTADCLIYTVPRFKKVRLKLHHIAGLKRKFLALISGIGR